MADDGFKMFLVLTTFPDSVPAREVAGRLLDERLAACVTVLPAAESHYVWNGERQVAAEVPVMIKTTGEAYPRLEARLRELHPYEVPEIIAVPVASGLKAYLDWVEQSCALQPPPSDP
jgi:periplasmic divalent cation tolerance protein